VGGGVGQHAAGVDGVAVHHVRIEDTL